ncbi:MAG: response regulator [Lachnospiraceae bacterium]|nr:response regulator [Lachnospiraceae bacterium]
MKNSILFIEGSDGFIPKAIIKKLKDARFNLICINDTLDEITQNRNSADMIFYYLSSDSAHMQRTLQYLFELCQNEHKTLTLAGEPFNMAKAKKQDSNNLIYATYQRPINIDGLVQKMLTLSNSYTEFNRTKSILIIDDDNDFIQVMYNWLKCDYRIDAVRSSREVIKYLGSFRPDLILLDYELPESDGYQLLDQIRKSPITSNIPIVFLTGKNDRESVMSILKLKPDGYLLKSMCRDELLDSLNRFFATNIFSQKKTH